MQNPTTEFLFDTSLRRVSGIYLIQHIASKKAYVGSTKDLGHRRSEHFTTLERGCHKNRHLQRAFAKYGRKAFRFLVLEECERERLIEREQYWIDFYQSADKRHGYNLNPLAGRSTPSEETRLLIGEKSRGRVPSKETCQRIAKANRGKKRSEETKRKLSKSATGRKLSEETKNKLRGRVFSEETRRKLSEAKKRRVGWKHSEETLQKMRLSRQRRERLITSELEE